MLGNKKIEGIWAASGGGDFKILEEILHPNEMADLKAERLLKALPDGAVLFLDPIDAHPLPPLKARVEWALKRYEGFYRHEAPESFRKKHPSAPTLEGVLDLGRLKRYWKPEEDLEAQRILEGLVTGKGGK